MGTSARNLKGKGSTVAKMCCLVQRAIFIVINLYNPTSPILLDTDCPIYVSTLHTCSTHTYMYAACAVSSLFLSVSSFPLSPSHTSLHSYHSPDLYRIVVFIDSGPSDSQYPNGHVVQTQWSYMTILAKLSLMVGMLLWSTPNHSPSRASHGYHVASLGC